MPAGGLSWRSGHRSSARTVFDAFKSSVGQAFEPGVAPQGREVGVETEPGGRDVKRHLQEMRQAVEGPVGVARQEIDARQPKLRVETRELILELGPGDGALAFPDPLSRTPRVRQRESMIDQVAPLAWHAPRLHFDGDTGALGE